MKRRSKNCLKLRTAHNFWYIYTRPEISDKVNMALKLMAEKEEEVFATDKV